MPVVEAEVESNGLAVALSESCLRAKSLQWCSIFAALQTVHCQAPLSMAFSRQEYWGWVAMPHSKGSSQPRDRTHVSYICGIGRQVFYHRHHLGSPSQKPTSTQLILERKNICGLKLHVMDRLSLNNV